MDVGGTLPLESSTCPNYFSLKATLSQMSNVTDFVGFKNYNLKELFRRRPVVVSLVAVIQH